MTRCGSLRLPSVLVVLVAASQVARALDECLDLTIRANCPTGQTCSDPDPMVADDWTCTCTAPSTGAPVTGGKAKCDLDECTMDCPTCQKGVCTAAGQSCVDSHPLGDSLHDWICTCTGASLPAFSYGSPAVCTINECTTPANAKVCADQKQSCVDPDTKDTSANDWECRCKKPYVGTAKGAAATCVYDECVDNFANCAGAGQTCVDPDTSAQSLLDWKCVCVAPATGEQTRGVALCQFPGECTDNFSVCNTAGQTCVDPDTMVTGDWRCECYAPFTGAPVTGGPANCAIDECVAECPSCAKTAGGNVCKDAGQVCKDQDTHAISLKDWECECVDPQTGASRPMAVASCVLNECNTNAKTCDPHLQACEDPDPSPGSLSDWRCLCAPPSRGEGKQAVATCVLDECETKGSVCLTHGQACVDVDTHPDKKDDWECRCIAPATGTKVAAQAECHYQMGDECETNQKTCSDKGQLCRDLNITVADNWRCECVAPSTGVPKVKGAAECTLDECSADCPTCATKSGENACTRAHQKCTDPDSHPDSLQDWTCSCALPGGMPAVGRPTVCTVDECAMVSCGLGQTCSDPNVADDSRGDYICTCDMGRGKQVGGPATCGMAIVLCLLHRTRHTLHSCRRVRDDWDSCLRDFEADLLRS